MGGMGKWEILVDLLEDGGGMQWGRGMVSEPRARSCTCHPLHLPLAIPVRDGPHPSPDSLCSWCNESGQDRPARLVVILQGPHGPFASGAPRAGHPSGTVSVGPGVGERVADSKAAGHMGLKVQVALLTRKMVI